MQLVISVFEQGFIYSIMALGIYITYKILDFPDLTVDGSFPMGAAIAALLITKGVPAILTLPIAFAAGGFVGFLTGVIHVKLHVRDLLSGIIMMTALYSVNLRIMGRANIPLYSEETIRQAFSAEPKENQVFLPGVMSRKKQIIPMLTALWG